MSITTKLYEHDCDNCVYVFTTHGEAAALVSALQQGGWDAADEAYDAIVEAGLDLGL